MLQTQRQIEILNKLKENPALTTKQLAQELKVSEMTIRRDFNDLVQQGLIVREHGGAMLPHQTINQFTDQMMEKKLRLNVSSKEAIAKAACELIKEGDCILIDSGTTTLALLPYLQNKKITVVLFSDLTLRNLPKFAGDVILLGGSYNFDACITYGPICLSTLQRFNFDICFLSCIAINIENGAVFTAEMASAQLKESSMQRSNQKVLMSDYSKFDQNGFYHFAQIDDFDYIFTDFTGDLKKFKERTTVVVTERKD